MKNLIITLWLGLYAATCLGQIQLDREVIGSEGGWDQNGSLYLNYSVGEAIISANDLLVGIEASEGFIQPLPLLASPLSDSVWPGDANHDGIADQFDLLTIGIGYGSTGPLRPNASLNWAAQYAPDWNDSLLTGVNYKHIDCNGDGLIDDNDTLALQLNFGLSHNKGSLSGVGAPLYAEILQDTLFAGDTAEIHIFYGADTLPAEDVYGLGFFLEVDTALVEMSSARVFYPSSFMGQKGSNLLTFDRVLEEDGQIAMALVGKDHLDRSGYGLVGKVTIIMIDDLAGKQAVYENLGVGIREPLALDQTARIQPVQVVARDSAVLTLDETTALESGLTHLLEVYPNPAQDQVRVQLQEITALGIQLRNTIGQTVLERRSSFQQTNLNLSHLATGIYLLTVETEQGEITRKLLIER